MMKIIAAAALGVLFFSCNPCNNLECAPTNASGQFRIIRAADGADLLFGPARIYDRNTIRFYFLQGADTSFLPSQVFLFPGATDSILQVIFPPEATTAYIRLSSNDMDTLTVSYAQYNSKCCGRSSEITTMRYNNRVNLPVNGGFQVLQK